MTSLIYDFFFYTTHKNNVHRLFLLERFPLSFIVINYNIKIEGVILCDRRWVDFKLLYPLMSVNIYKLFLIVLQNVDNNFSFIKKKEKKSIKIWCY